MRHLPPGQSPPPAPPPAPPRTSTSPPPRSRAPFPPALQVVTSVAARLRHRAAGPAGLERSPNDLVRFRTARRPIPADTASSRPALSGRSPSGRARGRGRICARAPARVRRCGPVPGRGDHATEHCGSPSNQAMRLHRDFRPLRGGRPALGADGGRRRAWRVSAIPGRRCARHTYFSGAVPSGGGAGGGRRRARRPAHHAGPRTRTRVRPARRCRGGVPAPAGRGGGAGAVVDTARSLA